MTLPQVADSGDREEITLAGKLNRLFATIHPQGRGEFTLEEVVSALRQEGVTISIAYLSQMRNGQRANPSKNVLEALAKFFGVSPAYFFSDDVAKAIEAQLDLVIAMRRASVQQIALRANDLSEASLRNLAALIDHWRELERPSTTTKSNE